MKNKSLFLILLSIFLVSCKSPLDNLSKKDDSALATVTFDIGLENSQNSRKIVPTYTTEDGKPFYTAFTYELIATDKNDPENNLTLSNKKYDELTSLEAELYIGHIYNFELNAYNKENTKVLSGTQNEVTIAKTDNKISFLLNSVSTTNGKFEIKFLDFELDPEYGTLVLNLSELSDFLKNNSNAKNLAKIENGIIDTENRTFTYSDSLPPGEYYFSIAISKNGIVNTCFSDQITIVSSLTTEKTLFFACEHPTTNLYLNGGTFDFKSEEFISLFEGEIPLVEANNCYQLYDEQTICFIDSFNPKKTGYIFLGWYLDPEFSIPFVSTNQTANMFGNISLYAKWFKTSASLTTELPIYTGWDFYLTNDYTNYDLNYSIYTDRILFGIFAISPDSNTVYISDNNDSVFFQTVSKISKGETNPTILFESDNFETNDLKYGSQYQIESLTCLSDTQLFVLTNFYETNNNTKSLAIYNTNPTNKTILNHYTINNVCGISDNISDPLMAANNKEIAIAYKLNNKFIISQYLYKTDDNLEEIISKEITFPFADITKITDFICSNGNYYLSTNSTNINRETDTVHFFGNIYQVFFNNENITVKPLINEFIPSKPYLSGPAFKNSELNLSVYGTNDANDTEMLFGPVKLFAISPKKLIILDSGYFVYVDYNNRLDATDVNRFVEIDLESKVVDYIQTCNLSPVTPEADFSRYF